MSYEALSRLDLVFRPIDRWPGELTINRRWSSFQAGISNTVGILARELEMLGAKSIVLQVALREQDIRLDGFPRAGRSAAHPGVILAFESRHGPLKFVVDTFRNWEDNLRAIALGMEALRKVDRYGVTKRGEQYTGWRALPASTDRADLLLSEEQALEWIDQWLVPGKDDVASAVRKALFATHPDHGGNDESFRVTMKARDLLAGLV